MRRMSATEAARRFSELLDAVEGQGETFVVVRRGRAVAAIGPTSGAHGREVKAILREHGADAAWESELRALREALTPQERAWNG
jgi:antitoxin (DNA-binding transcriptional repressor) of toxin-antitoxin stability system